MDKTDFMKRAIELARLSAEEGEVPVGAVIVRDGEIIATGRNRRETGKNALCHAEIEAIDNACRTLGGWRLPRCELYVTLEPCPMCAGAIINARIEKVYFGAYDAKAGSVGSVTDLFALPYNHRPEKEGGVLEEECAAQLSDFFRQLRKNKQKKNGPKTGGEEHCMDKKWRVGLIGNGGICKGCHLNEYLTDERLEVAAVCDIIEERAQFLKDKYFPNADVYTDYKELLKDETIDSVDICTPNYLHSIIAVDAFAAGKHVFCEKPDAVSVEEALKMDEAARKAGKTLMVMRNNRHVDISKFAKKYIDSGKMGEIYCGRCGWQRRRGIPGKGGWFTTKAQSGGGPLIDLGVHLIDLAMWFMGNPTPVAVSGSTYCKFADSDLSDSVNSDFGDKNAEGTFDVEDLAMGMIRFDNGAVLQIEFSWASNIKEESRFVELRGTKSGLLWKDGKVEIYTEEDGELIDIAAPNAEERDGHGRNLKHFYDVVIDGAEPGFVPQQGIDMIKILCAIYESAKTGREVLL